MDYGYFAVHGAVCTVFGWPNPWEEEEEFRDLVALEENMRYLWQTLHGVTTICANATPILIRNGM